MHLLCRQDVKDFAAWKESFDSEAEDRRDAGLTLLQLWRELDDPNRVFCLFKVNARDRAQTFLDGQTRLHADRAGVVDSAFHFLETL